MYHLLFVILLAFSFLEFFGKNNKMIAKSIFILMLLFVALRYGQGSDYFSYIHLINHSANIFETALLNKDFSIITQELSLVSYMDKSFTTNSELLIAVISSFHFY